MSSRTITVSQPTYVNIEEVLELAIDKVKRRKKYEDLDFKLSLESISLEDGFDKSGHQEILYTFSIHELNFDVEAEIRKGIIRGVKC